MDLGDLPEPLYPTYFASNGAAHVITDTLYFGSLVDKEGNGQPNDQATGDDITGVPDDEDGIKFLKPLMPNTTATISMTAYVSGPTAYYGAFIDFNGDGSFGTGEVFTGTIPNGGLDLTVSVPGVVSDTIFSRFRIAFSRVRGRTGDRPSQERRSRRLRADEPGQPGLVRRRQRQPGVRLRWHVQQRRNHGGRCDGDVGGFEHGRHSRHDHHQCQRQIPLYRPDPRRLPRCRGCAKLPDRWAARNLREHLHAGTKCQYRRGQQRQRHR